MTTKSSIPADAIDPLPAGQPARCPEGDRSNSIPPDGTALSDAYHKLHRKIEQASTPAQWWECMIAIQNIRFHEADIKQGKQSATR